MARAGGHPFSLDQLAYPPSETDIDTDDSGLEELPMHITQERLQLLEQAGVVVPESLQGPDVRLSLAGPWTKPLRVRLRADRELVLWPDRAQGPQLVAALWGKVAYAAGMRGIQAWAATAPQGRDQVLAYASKVLEFTTICEWCSRTDQVGAGSHCRVCFQRLRAPFLLQCMAISERTRLRYVLAATRILEFEHEHARGHPDEETLWLDVEEVD